MAQQNQDPYQNKLVQGEPRHGQTTLGSIVVPHDAEVVTIQPTDKLPPTAHDQAHDGPTITGNEAVVTDEINRMSPAATQAAVEFLSKPGGDHQSILATMNPSQPPGSGHYKL